MATEIERKFLVVNERWRDAVQSEVHLVQAYLSHGQSASVRVRITGGTAFLTVKGRVQGVSRSEYEYEIPVADAHAMLSELAASPPVDKTRYRVRCGDHVWELDRFHGANAGLVMAEVELHGEDESFQLPDWAGQEVSDDPRYYNSNLALRPFTTW